MKARNTKLTYFFLFTTTIISPVINLIWALLFSKHVHTLVLIFAYVGVSREISHDLKHYEELYVSFFSQELWKESLFYWMTHIFFSLGISFKLFLYIYLLFSFFLLSKITSELANGNVILHLLFFSNIMLFNEYFDQSTHLMRQFFSQLILFYAFLGTYKDRPHKWLLFLIAICVHSSALIALPYYALINFRFRIGRLVLLSSVAFLVLFLLRSFISNSELYLTLFELSKVDNTNFGETGKNFIRVVWAIGIIDLLMTGKRLDTNRGFYVYCLTMSLLFLLLPDRLYILQNRFIMFGYLPALLLLLLKLRAFLNNNTKTAIILCCILVVNIFRYIGQLNDVFIYKINVLNVFVL